MNLQEALKERDEDLLKERNEKIVSLCKDFIQEERSAQKIEHITDLLSHYMQDDRYKPAYIRDITYSMTRLISFLAYLNEEVSFYEGIEGRLEPLRTTKI